VIANESFLQSNPAVEKLFEVATIDINDVSLQNSKIRDGEDSSADIDRHVEEWIINNRADFDAWLAAARKAAQ
jgi:glycine betaine/proline transport system substrate-binding protein